MDIVTALANAAGAIFNYLDTQASKKYLDELVSTQKALLDERNKGPLRDDGLLQYLHDKLSIISQAAVAELARKQK